LRILAALALWFLAFPALAEPALWVAKTGGATVYLFGTVHALKSDTPWWTPKIAAAFVRSQEIWVESRDDEPNGNIAKLGYDRARPLSSKLSAEELERLNRAAKAAGLPGESALDSMRPWLAASTLMVKRNLKAGYDPDYGADHLLEIKAAAAHKPVYDFETGIEQTNFLATLTESTEIQFLRAVLYADGSREAITTEIDAWLNGDTRTTELALDSMKRGSPDLYAALIANRNKVWARRIVTLMRSGSGGAFVAVGAAHLAGPDCLQNALEAHGITVERQ